MRGVNLHAHHIRPRDRGGTHKKRNLVSVCRRCHNQIHHGSVENPSHENPLEGALEAIHGINWEIKERISRSDVLDIVRSTAVPSVDSVQTQLSLVDRGEDVGFSPRSFSDIIRDVSTHSQTGTSECNTMK